MARLLITLSILLTSQLVIQAHAADDSSRCYSIRDSDLRQACLAETRNNKGTCYAISDPDRRQLCIAQTTGQKSSCYNVRDKDKKAACLAGMALP